MSGESGGRGRERAAGKGRETGPMPDWRAVWPLPVLAGAIVLLVAGLVTAVVTKPEADTGAPLRRARSHIEGERYEEAIKVLNEDMLGFVRSGMASQEQVAEFYRVRAEAIYLGQAALGISRDENHRRIVENYESAEKEGLKLKPGDLEKLAEALVSLDRPEAAARRLDQIPEEERDRRRRVIRRIVEYNLSAPDLRRDMTLRLLAQMSEDPQLPLEERLWSAAREAELRLEDGAFEVARSDLTRELIALEKAASKADLAELHLLLGRAYFEIGEADALEKADENAAIAEESYAERAEGQGEAIVLRGRISMARDELDEARERFGRVRADFGGTSAYLPALMGFAEVESLLGSDETALEAYAELVDRSRRGERRRDVTPETVRESLMMRHADRYLAGEFRTALAYAQLADSIYGAKDVPEDVLLALAETHRRLAEGMLSDEAGARLDHRAIRRLDAVTRAEAQRHLMDAGRFYLAHADRVLLGSHERYLDSLWLAADSLDLGGVLEDAAEAFSRYHDGATTSDQRRPEARFRLAQIFQAKGEYEAAEPLYRELIDNRAGADGAAKGVGRWADASVVPLAQCYLADEDAENDAEAERLLSAVVEGSVLDPEAIEFREALLELATVKHRAGEYAEAVRLFDEAAQRYPDDERVVVTRYQLADSYRLLAGQIEETLRQAMPTAERQEREEARRTALGNAKRLFEQVRAALNAKPVEDLTALERLYMRNAAFYIGDCAFDMEDYEEAIRAYGEAAEQYARDPSSLVAKVQIVNAYVAMKQWDNALTAQERARQHYQNLTERFGDEVWDDPSLPMEQKHWERWLSSGRQLQTTTAAAGEG